MNHHEDKREIALRIVEAAVWCGEKDPEKLCKESTIWELKEIAEALGVYDEEAFWKQEYE